MSPTRHITNIILLSLLVLCHSLPSAFAQQRKFLSEVNTDELIQDAQVTPAGVKDDHACVIWWLPKEFWASTLSKDNSLKESERAGMMEIIEGVSLLGIVQADISNVGSFRYYPQADIRENLSIEVLDQSGKSTPVKLQTSISPDLELILSAFKPILSQAMGNLGNNLHFFVINDKTEDGTRLLDPFEAGKLRVKLKDSRGNVLTGSIMLPLNALFTPRKCPNGENAHISWQYCPWSGEKL